MNWVLLTNSLMVALLALAAAAVFGLSAALCGMTVGRRGRRLLAIGMVIAFALPSFMVTGLWIDLLGKAGRFGEYAPFDIYSLWGCAWILGLMLWPVIAAAAWIAWRRLDAAELECDSRLRGGWMLRDLLIPTAVPVVRLAAGVVFVLALGNFAVPAILQVKTYPAEIWLRFNTANDAVGAFLIGWPLLLAPAILLLAFRHRRFRMPHVSGNVSVRLFRSRMGGNVCRVNSVFAFVVVALSVGLPVLQLLLSERTMAIQSKRRPPHRSPY